MLSHLKNGGADNREGVCPKFTGNVNIFLLHKHWLNHVLIRYLLDCLEWFDLSMCNLDQS